MRPFHALLLSPLFATVAACGGAPATLRGTASPNVDDTCRASTDVLALVPDDD